jgi:hypothetical protein
LSLEFGAAKSTFSAKHKIDAIVNPEISAALAPFSPADFSDP